MMLRFKMFSTQPLKTMLKMNFRFELKNENGFREKLTRIEKTFTTPHESTKFHESIKNMYPDIDDEAANWKPRSSTSISLSGKLNGINIDEQFSEFNSYTKFLEKNALLSKSTCELKPK